MANSADDLNALQRAARNWALEVVKLYNTPVPKDLEPEKQKLLERAKWLKDKIEAITGKLDVFQPMTQVLGIWPIVVGIIGAGAAASYIAYWYSDNKKLNDKIATRNKLVADGMPLPQAVAIVNKMYREPGVVEKILSSTPAKIGALSLLGWWLLSKRAR